MIPFHDEKTVECEIEKFFDFLISHLRFAVRELSHVVDGRKQVLKSTPHLYDYQVAHAVTMFYLCLQNSANYFELNIFNAFKRDMRGSPECVADFRRIFEKKRSDMAHILNPLIGFITVKSTLIWESFEDKSSPSAEVIRIVSKTDFDEMAKGRFGF